MYILVAAQEDHVIVIAHPGQDVKLSCTITPSDSQTAAWVINNGGPHTVQQLHNGILAGYSSNGNDLIIENIMMNDDRNDTEYSCVTVPSTVSQPTIADIIDESNPIILYVAGEFIYVNKYIASYICSYIATCLQIFTFIATLNPCRSTYIAS